MTYLVDIIIVLNNNSLSFINNIKYTWAKFISDKKMTKKSIKIFLTILI